MSSGDGATQYVPLDKLKLYQNNVLFNRILRRLNFSNEFTLFENAATDSVDIGIGTEIQSLTDLVDVVVTTPLTKQFMRYDGSNWVNAFGLLDDLEDVDTTTSGNPQAGHTLRYDGTKFVNAFPFLDDLIDVVASNPQAQQVIRHNGINWLNAFLSSSDLSDVEVTTPTTGQVLRYDGTNFVNVAASAIALLLNDLTDVIITAAANGQFLGFNGSNWVNTLIALNALSDVVIGSLASGQTLQYDGTNWVNVLLTLNVLTDTVINSPTNGQVLQYNGTSWVNSTPTPGLVALNDLSDVVITTPSAGHILRYSGTSWVNIALAELIAINQLSDVSLTSPTSGDVLTFSGGAWINQQPSRGGGGGASALTDLSDVSITSAALGDILRHNGTSWVDIPIAELLSLTQLSDVALSAPTTAHVLRHTGSSWVNSLLNIGDLTPVSISAPSNGQQLVFNGTNWVNQTIAQASNVSFLPDTVNNGSNWGLWSGGARQGTGLFAGSNIEGTAPSSRQDSTTNGKVLTAFVTGSSNNDTSGFRGQTPTQAGFYIRRDQNFLFKTKIQVPSTSELRFAIGLIGAAQFPLDTDTYLASGIAGFLFYFSSGTNNIRLLRNDTSGTAINVDTGTTLAVNTAVTLEIQADNANSRIGWRMNESGSFTYYTSDIPLAATSMNYGMRVEAKAGGARELDVHYAYLTQAPS